MTANDRPEAADRPAHLKFLPAAVIFDMDGLMLDTEVIYHRAWRQAAGELGYALTDELLHSTLGIRTVDCEVMIGAALGDDFPLRAFLERWPVAWVEDAEANGIALKPGLVELLDLLDERGIPKAVATSSTAVEAERSLGLAGIRRRFDVVVSGDQVAHGKPAPDLFLAAAARLAVDPTRCVAFEDSDAGTLSAARSGMTTFIVPDLKPPSPEAVTRAAGVLQTLHEARPLFGT